MKTQTIEKLLSWPGTPETRVALEVAMQDRAALIPLLLDILEKTPAEIDKLRYDEPGKHLAAALILAQFRAKEAFPELLSLVSDSSQEEFDLLWPTVFDSLGAVLADTFDGNLEALKTLVLSEQVSPDARWVALDTIGLLYHNGQVPRLEYTAYIRNLLESANALADHDIAEETVESIAYDIIDYHLDEILPLMKPLITSKLIDQSEFEDYAAYLDAFNNKAAEFRGDKKYHIDDALQWMDKLEWFLPEENWFFRSLVPHDEDLAKNLKKAIAEKEKIIPVALESLEYVTKFLQLFVEIEMSYDSHIVAAFLLAQFREKKAFPLIVNLLHADTKTCDYLWGDIASEDMPAILRDTFDGNLDFLEKLILDTNVDQYARCSAIDTLGLLHYDGKCDFDFIYSIINKLQEELLGNDLTDENDFLPEYIAHFTADYKFEKLIPIVQNFDKEGILRSEESYEFFEWRYNEDREDFDSNRFHINDTAARLRPYRWFEPEEDEDEDDADYDGYEDEDFSYFRHVSDEINSNGSALYKVNQDGSLTRTEKIGRNDPCPCGSGKKYKHCHGKEA
jgi:hypothetical protein